MEHVTISTWYFQLHSMQIFNSRRIAKQFSKTLCTHCDFIHKVFVVACIDNFCLKNSVLIHMTMSSLLWLTILFMEVNRSKTGFFKSYSALLVTSYCALCRKDSLRTLRTDSAWAERVGQGEVVGVTCTWWLLAVCHRFTSLRLACDCERVNTGSSNGNLSSTLDQVVDFKHAC